MSGEKPTCKQLSERLAQAQEQLGQAQASQTGYLRLFQSMTDPYVRVDMSGRFIEFNDAYCAMTGYSAQELLTRTYTDITPPKWHAFEADILEKQILPRGFSDIYEKEYVRKDGTIIPVELRTLLLRDDAGQPSSMWAIIRDITDRHRAEEALRREETRYRAIFDSTDDGIFLMRGDRFIDCNQAGVRLLKCRKEDIVNQSPLRFSPARQPDGQDSAVKARHLIDAAMDGRPQRYEWRIQLFDGTDLDVETTLNRFFLDREPHLLVLVRDITNRNRAKDDLARYSRRLQVLSQAVETINSVLDVPIIMRNLVASAMELTGAAGGTAGLSVGDKILFTEYNLQGRIFPVDYQFPHGAGIPGVVMKSRRPYLTDDALHDQYVIPEIQKELRFETLIDVPILSREGKFLGCFEIHNKASGPFNQTDAYLLKGLAAGAAIALENTQMLLDHKRSEEAVRKSELQMRMAVEGARMGAWQWEFNTSVTTFQGRGPVSGLPQEIRPTNINEFWSLVHPDDRHRVGQVVQNSLDQEVPYQVDFRILLPDGTIRWVSGLGQFLRDADGAKIGLIGIDLDITDAKQAQESSRQNQAMLESVLNSVPQAIFWKDRNGVYTGCNQVFAKAVGFDSPNAVVGKTDFDLPWPRQEAQAYRKDDEEVMTTKLPKRHIIEPLQQADGKRLWIDTTKVPLLDPHGDSYGILGVYEDVTELRSAEEAVHESERRLSTLMANLPGIAYRCRPDRDWTMEFVSEGVLELTGYPASDITNNAKLSFNDIIHPDDRQYVWNQVQDALREKRSFQITYRIITAAGEQKWAWEKGSGVFDSQGVLQALEGFIADISDRKAAEEALHEQENILRLFVKHTPAAIAMFDRDMRYLVHSDRWVADYGLGSQSLIGRTHYEVFPEIDQRWKVIHQRCLQGVSEKTDEDHFIRQDGRTEWLRWEIHPWRTRDGQVGGLIMFTEVITARKEAQEELRSSQEMLRNILDHFPGVVFWKDRNSVYLGCNRAFAAAADLDAPTDIVGKTDFDLPWARTEAQAYRDDDRAVIQSGQPKLDILESQFQADGRIAWFHTSKIPLADGDGNIIGILGTSTDITERRQAQESLRLSQFAMDHASDGIYMIDEDARILYVNDKACTLLGYSQDEMRSMTIFDIDPDYPKSKWAARWKDLRQKGSLTSESFHTTKDGRKIPVEINANVVEYGGKVINCAIARDITERRKAQEDIKKLNTELELRVQRRTAQLAQANTVLQERAAQLRALAAELTRAEERERRRIAYILHEDLQQLLVGAKYHLAHLAAEPHPDIAAGATKASNILDQAVQLSRSLTLQLRPPVLYELGLAPAVEWLGNQLHDQFGLSVEVTADTNAEPPSDELRIFLFRAIREALLNVAKHAKVKTAQVEIRQPAPQRLDIVIRDEGVGFDPAQAENQLKDQKGFGLFSIRERLELLGGHLTVKSAPGKGTIIKLSIPLNDATPPADENP